MTLRMPPLNTDVRIMQALPHPIMDCVPDDSPGAREIGFSVPDRYNASAILFDNLTAGRGERVAVTGPGGTRTYRELCTDAAKLGNGLLSLGCGRGDRVLLFLDDTPAYPAAFFGAIRAGLVPLLINTLTPPDLLQFFLADSSAKAAIADAGFADRFNSAACSGTHLETVIVVGEPFSGAAVRTLSLDHFASRISDALELADTHRDEMAFWMYSSGSTGRPKGIVHLQHDMAYTTQSYARHVLAVQADDRCFSVPKIFFAYGLGNSLTFPFSVGASSVLLPGQPKPDRIFQCIAQYRPTIFFGLPTLYTALTKAPEAAAADLSSLRLCVSAAEVLSLDVFESWKAISDLEIVEGLGSTEALHIYLSNSVESKKTNAAGRRVPGYELALKNADGGKIEGEAGILWVRGHSSAPCY
jgi:acetyl-CoA synthetase